MKREKNKEKIIMIIIRVINKKMRKMEIMEFIIEKVMEIIKKKVM